MGADEALLVPGLATERHAPAGQYLVNNISNNRTAELDHLFALCALGCHPVLEAAHAINVLFVGDDERLQSHLGCTHLQDKEKSCGIMRDASDIDC